MRFLYSTSAFLLIAALATLITACNDTTVGPSVGNGTTLEATISGIPLTLNVSAPPVSNYDAATQRVTVAGTLVGDTTKSVTLFFTFNIDQGTYPTTLTEVTEPDLNLVCIITSGSVTQTYNLDAVASDHCSVTLTAGNGTILDGTFAGTISNKDDRTKKITITNGRFSAKLRP
jgi:hypothetical protein